jgi:hypothetical protein
MMQIMYEWERFVASKITKVRPAENWNDARLGSFDGRTPKGTRRRKTDEPKTARPVPTKVLHEDGKIAVVFKLRNPFEFQVSGFFNGAMRMLMHGQLPAAAEDIRLFAPFCLEPNAEETVQLILPESPPGGMRQTPMGGGDYSIALRITGISWPD